MEEQYTKISNIVLGQIEKFEKKYTIKPRFVKFPMFWTRVLVEYQDKYLQETWNIIYGNSSEDKNMYFYDLQICETPTIIEAEEIEVF